MAMKNVNDACKNFNDAIIRSKGDFEKVKEAYRKFYKYYKNDRLEYAEMALGQLKKAKYKIKAIDKLKEFDFLGHTEYDHNNLAIGKEYIESDLEVFLDEFQSEFGTTGIVKVGRKLLDSIRQSKKKAEDTLSKTLEEFVSREKFRIEFTFHPYMETMIKLTPEDSDVQKYKTLLEKNDNEKKKMLSEWKNTIQEIVKESRNIYKVQDENEYLAAFEENAERIENLNVEDRDGFTENLNIVTNFFTAAQSNEDEGKIDQLIDKLTDYRNDIEKKSERFRSDTSKMQKECTKRRLNFLKKFPLECLKNTYEIKDTGNEHAKKYVDVKESLDKKLDKKGVRLNQLKQDSLEYIDGKLEEYKGNYATYKLQRGNKIIGYKWLDKINKGIKADKGKEAADQKFTPYAMADNLEGFAKDVLKNKEAFGAENAVNTSLKAIAAIIKGLPSPQPEPEKPGIKPKKKHKRY